MRQKSRCLFGICAGFILAALLLVKRNPQPSYQGISLETWLLRYSDASSYEIDVAGQEKAAEAIRLMGDTALPDLLKWIAYEQTPSRQKLLKLVSRLPSACAQPLARSIDRTEIRTALAQKAFNVLGRQASNAVPGLINLMVRTNNARSSVRAMMALQAIGEPAVNSLRQALSSQDPATRRMADYVLTNMPVQERAGPETWALTGSTNASAR